MVDLYDHHFPLSIFVSCLPRIQLRQTFSLLCNHLRLTLPLYIMCSVIKLIKSSITLKNTYILYMLASTTFVNIIRRHIKHPYNKVNGCLSVPKNLANRWTDRVLLNRVASHRSKEGLLLFLGRVTKTPSQEKSPLKIKWCPPAKKKYRSEY